MTALPQTPAGRIALAIVLSLLVHAIVLFAPLVKFPPREAPRPPIIAKLELLPKITQFEPPPVITAKPALIKKEKSKPQSTPVAPVPVVAETVTQPDKRANENKPTEEPQLAPEPPLTAAVETAEETNPAHPLLPRHAQLSFAVYKGTGGFQVGEARHKLEITDHHYNLTATTETIGIASIFKTYQLVQTSRGILTKQGIRPEQYNEDKSDAQGKQSLSADFDWENHTLSLSGGNKTELTAQTQDVLSFLYQFSQLSLATEIVPLSISNGKKLEHYDFEVGAEELIDTRLGQLRTVKLRKIHATGMEGTEIWLGLDYRLLPVKIRQIDRAGEIAGEMLISEIRIADE